MSTSSEQAQAATREFKVSASSSAYMKCNVLYAEKGEKDDIAITTVFIARRNEDAGSRDATTADEALNGQLTIGTPEYETIRFNGQPLPAEGESAAQNLRNVLSGTRIQEGLSDFLLEAVRSGSTPSASAASLTSGAFNASYRPYGKPVEQLELQVQEDGSATIAHTYANDYIKAEDQFNLNGNPEVTQSRVRIVYQVEMQGGKLVAHIVNRDFTVAGKNEQDLNTMGVLLASKLKLHFEPKAKKINGTALWDAVDKGNIEAVEALFAAGVQKNIKNDKGETALWYAVRVGQKNVVAYLLTLIPAKKRREKEQNTALLYAAGFGQVELISFLLSNGANVNTRDSIEGKTPLHCAAKFKHYAPEMKMEQNAILALIARGAEIEAVDKYGKTALHYAAEAGNVSVINVLIMVGAKVDALDNQGKTPLHYAAEAGDGETINALLGENGCSLLGTAGAKIEAADKQGKTALHYAAESGNTEIVNLFILVGADLRIADKQGKTALHYAASNGNTDIIDSLVKAEADVNSNELTTKKTPLHCATEAENMEAVKFLIEHGANIDLRDTSGKAAVDYALESKNEALIQILSLIAETALVEEFKNCLSAPQIAPSTKNPQKNVIKLKDIHCQQIQGSLMGDITKIPTPSDYEFQTYTDLQRLKTEITIGNTLLSESFPGLRIDNREMTQQDQVKKVKGMLSDIGVCGSVIEAIYQTLNQGSLYAHIEANIMNSIQSTREDDKSYDLQQDRNTHYDITCIEDGGVRITEVFELKYTSMQNDLLRTGVIDGRFSITIKPVNGKVEFHIEEIEFSATGDDKFIVEERILDGLYSESGIFVNVMRGKEAEVQKAIETGALTADNINDRDRSGKTVLHHAMKRGHLAIAALLIVKGAGCNIPDLSGKTALDYLRKQVTSDANMLAIIAILQKPESAGEKINFQNNDKKTALHFAAAAGNSELVSAFLKAGADINLKDSNGATALHYAAQSNNTEVVKLLLYYDAAVDGQEFKNGNTALHYAVHNKNIEIVKMLLKIGAKNLGGGRNEATPLHCAAEAGSNSIVEAFLGSNSIDVNIQDSHQWTPLYSAVIHDRIDIVRKLIASSAAVTLKDGSGKTVLHHAAKKKDPRILGVLLKTSVDINCKDKSGKTALHYAIEEEREEAVITLLQQPNIQLNTCDNLGKTALQYAVEKGNVALVKALLEAGVSADYKDSQGKTALHCAVITYAKAAAALKQDVKGSSLEAIEFEKNRRDVAVKSAEAILLALVGADLTIADSEGKTALHYAVDGENVEAVKILLEAGVNIDLKDAQGNTALYYATKKEAAEIIEELLAAGANLDLLKPTDVEHRAVIDKIRENEKNTARIHVSAKRCQIITGLKSNHPYIGNIREIPIMNEEESSTQQKKDVHRCYGSLQVESESESECILNELELLSSGEEISEAISEKFERQKMIDYLVGKGVDEKIARTITDVLNQKSLLRFVATSINGTHGSLAFDERLGTYTYRDEEDNTIISIKSDRTVHLTNKVDMPFVPENGSDDSFRVCAEITHIFSLDKNETPTATVSARAKVVGKNAALHAGRIAEGFTADAGLYLDARQGKAIDWNSITSENVNIPDSAGKTMLYYALKNGHTEYAAHLIEKGADVATVSKELLMAENQYGKTVLSYTKELKCFTGCVDSLKEDIRKGGEKKTYLHYAVEADNLELIKQLITTKKGIDAKDAEGKTALHYAARAYGKAVKATRKEMTGSQSMRREAQPRRAAAVAKTEAIVLALVDAGANVTAKDNNQKKAWEYAPKGPVQTYLYVLTLVEGYCHHLEQSGASQQQRLAAVQKLKKALLVQDGETTVTLAERLSKFKNEYKPELIAVEKPSLASLLSSRFKRVFNKTQDVINPLNNETHAQAFTRYIQTTLSGIDDIIQAAEPKPKAEAKKEVGVSAMSDESCRNLIEGNNAPEQVGQEISVEKAVVLEDLSGDKQPESEKIESVATPAVQHRADPPLVAVAQNANAFEANAHSLGYEADNEGESDETLDLCDELNGVLNSAAPVLEDGGVWLVDTPIHEDDDIWLEDNDAPIHNEYDGRRSGSGFWIHKAQDEAQVQPTAVLVGAPSFAKREDS